MKIDATLSFHKTCNGHTIHEICTYPLIPFSSRCCKMAENQNAGEAESSKVALSLDIAGNNTDGSHDVQ